MDIGNGLNQLKSGSATTFIIRMKFAKRYKKEKRDKAFDLIPLLLRQSYDLPYYYIVCIFDVVYPC